MNFKDKDVYLNFIGDPAKKILMSKLLDSVGIYLRTGIITCTNFFDPYELELAESILKRFNASLNYSVFGCFDNAERNICVIHGINYNADYRDFIACFYIDINDESILHRDVLGAIMNLGIRRDFVGDIVFNDSRCCVVVKEEILNFLLSELTSIKKTSVRPRVLNDIDGISKDDSYEVKSLNISSLRIDNVLAGLFSLSRSKISVLMNSKTVKINFRECNNFSSKVKEGDIISVASKGRYKILKIGGFSRKGRIFIDIGKIL